MNDARLKLICVQTTCLLWQISVLFHTFLKATRRIVLGLANVLPRLRHHLSVYLPQYCGTSEREISARVLYMRQHLHIGVGLRLSQWAMVAAVAMALGAGGAARCDQRSYSGTAWQERAGIACQREYNRVARDLRLGTELDIQRLDCAFEMDRMFNAPTRDRSRSVGLLIQKALLTLPLIKSADPSELAIRPRSELAFILGRRAALQDRRNQPPISAPDGVIAVDLHVHTSASADSLASPTELLVAAARRGLAGIAITDHDSFEGVARAEAAAHRLIGEGKLPPHFLVIPGEEVSSSDGHVVGLFLKSRIPSGQTAEWTVRAIHEQGGIAIAAHPLVPTGVHDLANTLPFDAVETESASEKLHYAITPGVDFRVRAQFYAALTKPHVGSSDSHDAETIAECYTLVTCAPTLESMREAMLAGRVSAAATASESEERAIARRTVTRIVSAYRLLTRLNPLIPGLADSDSVTVSLLPCPAIRYCREF